MFQNKYKQYNFIKIKNPKLLEKIETSVSLFDIKTKCSQVYNVYNDFDWALIQKDIDLKDLKKKNFVKLQLYHI